MSRIDELIQQLCPDGVEYKPLEELCFLSRGKVISKDYLRNHPGIYPVFSSQTADDGVFGKIDSFEYDGEYLTWTTDGANAGSVFFRSGRFNITNVCGLIKLKLPEIRLRFLFYWLRVVAPSYVNAGMGNPKLMSNVMGTILCPIPPLPVQEEIVRILDKFTALEAELEAELEARRKQYEFYRDQLLTFGDEVEWKPLGEVCDDIQNIRWSEVNDQMFYYIDLSSVDRDFHKITTVCVITNAKAPSRAQQIVQKNDILFGTTRPLLKRFCIIPEKYSGQICSTGYCVLRPKQTIVLPLWIYYQISLQRFYDHIEKYQKGVSYPAITDSDVKRYRIPVPPLAEQERIVAILDKFDALVNDISSGLPAELEMRRKQYEYYRDRLLTFKPLAREA